MLKRCLTTSAVILLAAFVAGCAGKTPIVAPIARDIGPAPAYLQEVKVPAPRAGDSPVVDADRQARGLEKANTIICATREEWDRTRAALAVGGERPVSAPPGKCTARLVDRARRGKRKK